MAYEADRVVVEVIAKLDQLDKPVETSAARFDTNMDRIVASATKAEQAVTRTSSNRAKALERESAQISQFSRTMSNQLTDIGSLLSSSRSPFVAPVKDAPKLTAAFGLVQAGATAMGGVLGGIAVQGAFALVDALSELILKSGDTSDQVATLVEKLKENAEKTNTAERAQLVFSGTLEGVEAQVRATTKALDEMNASSKTAAERALEESEAQLIKAQGIRQANVEILEQARANLLNAQAVSFGAGGGASAQSASAFFQKQVDQIDAAIKRADKTIAQAQTNITTALSRAAVELVDTATDPLAKIKDKYEGPRGLIEQARQRAIAEGTVRTTLVDQLEILKKQQKTEEDTERARQRAARSTRTPNQQAGRQISVAQAESIVRGIGGTPTSGFRTVQHNEDVGGVKGSFHTKGQALDIAKTAGLTLDKIVKAFEAQGVRLIEKLDEGDHFHVAWAKRGTGRQGPSEETLAKRAAAEAERAANRAQAFDNEKANLEGQVINARQALVTSAEEIAQLELAAIDLARAKYADQVAHLQSIGKLQAGEAAELLKLNEERAKLRAEAVKRREDERKFRMREAEIQRAQAVQAGGLQAQGDLLQSQEAVAKTQRERAAIARRLLDLQFAEERLMLQAAIDRETRLKAEYARTQSAQILAELQQAEVDAALAKQQLATIDQRQSNAQASGERENASPLQSYFGDIQAEADDINTAFEKIAAGGLANFTDRLTDAIVNFRSLGDVGRAALAGLTADLVKLAIRLLINATIGKLIGKTATLSTAASAAAAAVAWAPAAALASLATLGANAAPAAAAIAATNAIAFATAATSAAGVAGAGLAGGGRVYGAGTSTSDSVPIRASKDEFMIKAQSARKIGYSNLEAMNATGRLPSNDVATRAIRPSNGTASAPRGSSGGFSQGDREYLAGEMRRAIDSMPPIQMYPVLRPEDALEAALSTPGGRRAMFKFFSDEPGAIGSTLG